MVETPELYRSGLEEFGLDDELIDILGYLNGMGYVTWTSCAGHQKNVFGYIGFFDLADEAELLVLMKTLGFDVYSVEHRAMKTLVYFASVSRDAGIIKE